MAFGVCTGAAPSELNDLQARKQAVLDMRWGIAGGERRRAVVGLQLGGECARFGAMG
jgi:hypothetical protein